MIRVTVELVPFGDEVKKKKIGEMVLANTGGDADTANYEAWVADAEGNKLFSALNGYNRSQGFWNLIRLLLEVTVLKELKPDKNNYHAKKLKSKLIGFLKD